MIDPIDLVNRRAYVRVYSGAVGHEDQVMAEGRVVWYHDGPMIGIEDEQGHQSAWGTRLRIEEVEQPLDPRLWLSGDEDCGVTLRCHACPDAIAYYEPNPTNAPSRSPKVHSLNRLMGIAAEHGAAHRGPADG